MCTIIVECKTRKVWIVVDDQGLRELIPLYDPVSAQIKSRSLYVCESIHAVSVIALATLFLRLDIEQPPGLSAHHVYVGNIEHRSTTDTGIRYTRTDIVPQ